MEKTVGLVNMDEIIDELSKMIMDNTTLRPDELTISQIIERNMKLKRSSLSYRLTVFVRTGLLQTREVTVDGKHMAAYSPTEGHDWKDVLQQIR